MRACACWKVRALRLFTLGWALQVFAKTFPQSKKNLDWRDVDKNLQSRTAIPVKSYFSYYSTKVEIYVQTEIKVIKCIGIKAKCPCCRYEISGTQKCWPSPYFLFLFLLRCESCLHLQQRECRWGGSAVVSLCWIQDIKPAKLPFPLLTVEQMWKHTLQCIQARGGHKAAATAGLDTECNIITLKLLCITVGLYLCCARVL